MPEGVFRPDDGWTLTATEPLARQLREAANLEASQSGATVWEAPNIAPLSRWCIDQWAASWPAEQLLSATQELILWRQAIERDGQQLISPQAAANEARRTDQILRRYQIDDQTPIWTDEHRAFRRWRSWVQSRLDQQGWLTSADIPAVLQARFQNQSIPAASEIRLAGFVDPPTPNEAALLSTLQAAGTRVTHQSANESTEQVEYLRFDSNDEQLRAVAVEVRQALSDAAPASVPSILIALPDVAAQRNALESVLRELVAPWVAEGSTGAPWRWLDSQSLSRQPWVELLLDLIQLAVEGNDPARLSRVLLSPILFDESDRIRTAESDLWLRERGAPRVHLESLCSRLSGEVGERFARLLGEIRSAPDKAIPSDWAAHFLRRLGAIAWPGARSLDSQAYQAVAAGRDLLDRLSTLDAQLESVPVETARHWLGVLAQSAFSPRADHLQPVRIASLEQAASLSADLLLVIDADCEHLPPPVKPLALVPIEPLREAGVPLVSPEAWLSRTQLQVQALLACCAPRVKVSVASVDERGAERLPSPLFAAAGAWQSAVVEAQVGAIEQSLHSDVGHAIHPQQDRVPEVGAAELQSLNAGVGLFEAWFEAPFFAFCKERLGIRELPLPQRGIASPLQGQVLHLVLCDFFGESRTQAELKALAPKQLRARLDALLDRHLPKYLPERDYGASLLALERGRMRSVLLEWLAHECRRLDPFEVIERECKARPKIAGLQLSLRIDRVDRVRTEQGQKCLVMDYKTGRNADPKGWKAEKSPQLPLYATHAALDVAGIEQVNGVCFSHLKEGHPAFSACTDWRKKLIEDPSADLRDDWASNLEDWHKQIDQAAREFQAGVATLPTKISAYSFNISLLQLASAPTPEDSP